MEDLQMNQEMQNPPPPSYSIAKEEDALAHIKNLHGLTLVLAEDKVKLQDQDDEIYSLSQDPRSGTGETLAFMLRVYKNRKSDHTVSRVANSKELYNVEVPYKWWNPKIRAFLPPMYSFSAETRTFYCYRPGCDLVKGNMKWLRWIPLIPFPIQNHLGVWRLIINTKIDRKSHTFQLLRRPKGHHSLEYEWTDANNKVVALEVVAGTTLHNPKLEIKADLEDRRLLHALVLAWVTIVWRDAKEEHLQDKAQEIAKTMSCKSINQR
jgi:hypothetical protein